MKKSNIQKNSIHYILTSDLRKIPSRFRIGDVVRVVNLGCRYTTYKDAFIYFGILNKAKKTSDDYYSLDYAYDLDTNWVVCDMAIHSQSDNGIIYYIRNKKNQHLVISGEGIENRNIIGNNLKKSKLSNKEFIIGKIPKYD